MNDLKLDLLKEYCALQANNEGLWFETYYITEAYLQSELRRITWLIEEAEPAEIVDAIDKCRGELGL